MKMKLQKWGLLLIAMAIMLLPNTVYGDTGPKPSVQITFENMGDEECYGTLLSKDSTTGPASAWDGTEENISDYGLDHDVWKAFVDYKDSDGYYFLQEAWLCSESKELDWTYYPPSDFKILLYYPKLNKFVVSEAYEKYAFDSYYSVDMEGIDIGSVNEVIVAEKDYDYTMEIVSLISRIIITIILELAVAWIFKLWQKKLIKVILCVNVPTQILLNVLLNIVNYNSGSSGFLIYYFVLEIMVFVIEAAIYISYLKKHPEISVSGRRLVLYALCSNAISFGGGLLVSKLIPGIF